MALRWRGEYGAKQFSAQWSDHKEGMAICYPAKDSMLAYNTMVSCPRVATMVLSLAREVTVTP